MVRFEIKRKKTKMRKKKLMKVAVERKMMMLEILTVMKLQKETKKPSKKL